MSGAIKGAHVAVALAVVLSASVAGRTAAQNSAEAGSKPLKRVLEAFDRGQGPPRIVGGRVVANIAEHPWQVALVAARIPTNVDGQFCGGSIVGTQWIATAAHCVDSGTQASQVQVLSGTASLEKGGQRVGVGAIAVHPRWNPDTSDFDIAILRVSGNFDARSAVGVAVGDQLKVGQDIAITGWGALAWRDPKGSTSLREAVVPFVSRDTCNRNASYGGRITANMMCAGKREGGVDSCQGDSGGPATVLTPGGRRLVGIVSWGDGCGFPNKYGVYSVASNFAAWVSEVTGGQVKWPER